MDISGNIGAGPATYDISIDNQLNVVLSAKAPIVTFLNALVAQLNSPAMTMVEQVLVEAAEAYIAAQPK